VNWQPESAEWRPGEDSCRWETRRSAPSVFVQSNG